MTLTLKIENFDSLPDGGPTSITVTEKTISVGRAASMDWSLPDPQRHISSHHFEVTYRDGSYWLTDMSTNGIFLDGHRHRLQGAHQVQTGDRFQVGHYFIVATVGGRQSVPVPPASPVPPVAQPPAYEDADPWAVDSGPVAPIDPTPRPATSAFDDFASDFIVNPNPAPVAPPAPTPAPPPPSPPPIPAAPSPMPGGSDSPFGDSPSPAAPQLSMPPSVPMPSLSTPPTSAPGLQTPPATSPVPAVAPAPVPVPPSAAAPGAHGNASNAAILAAFCEGAGLPAPAAGAATDPVELARELGRTMQAAAAELMALLQNRAEAKRFTRGGDRTMMGAANNNPLKFLPDPAQALEVMFLNHRDGFMSGGEGVAEALRDVKTHQMAVFAAIQPALIKLLEDLSPEAVEAAIDGGLLSGKRQKAWDEFVKRWDDKVANHENGMLDVFLTHFAESYAAAVAAARR